MSPFAGSVYGPLIDDQLERENDIKESLAQRGVVIVTTSGTLVGLIFGFSALATNGKSSLLALPHVTSFLVIAVFLFVVAAVAAILTNTAWTYEEFATSELERLCKADYWIYEDTVEAARSVSETKVGILKQARKQNERKAYALIVGFSAEVAAVSSVTLAVVLFVRAA